MIMISYVSFVFYNRCKLTLLLLLSLLVALVMLVLLMIRVARGTQFAWIFRRDAQVVVARVRHDRTGGSKGAAVGQTCCASSKGLGSVPPRRLPDESRRRTGTLTTRQAEAARQLEDVRMLLLLLVMIMMILLKLLLHHQHIIFFRNHDVLRSHVMLFLLLLLLDLLFLSLMLDQQQLLLFLSLHFLPDVLHGRAVVRRLVPCFLQDGSDLFLVGAGYFPQLGPYAAAADQVGMHLARPACERLLMRQNLVRDHRPAVHVGTHVIRQMTRDLHGHVPERANFARHFEWLREGAIGQFPAQAEVEQLDPSLHEPDVVRLQVAKYTT